jgi:hypothetical protein
MAERRNSLKRLQQRQNGNRYVDELNKASMELSIRVQDLKPEIVTIEEKAARERMQRLQSPPMIYCCKECKGHLVSNYRVQ